MLNKQFYADLTSLCSALLLSFNVSCEPNHTKTIHVIDTSTSHNHQHINAQLQLMVLLIMKFIR